MTRPHFLRGYTPAQPPAKADAHHAGLMLLVIFAPWLLIAFVVCVVLW